MSAFNHKNDTKKTEFANWVAFLFKGTTPKFSLSTHTHTHSRKIMHTCTRIHSRTHSWTLWVKLGEVCWIRESGCIPGYNGLTRSHTHIQTHTLSLRWKQKELYQSNLETADSLEQTTWERICSELKRNKTVDFTVQIHKCVLRNQVWEHWLTRLD